MGRASRSAFRVAIDPQQIGMLAADLKELEGGKRLAANLRRNLKAAAEPAAAQVRQNASWSSRIPGAVGVRVNFTSKRPAVSVFVGRKKAPHARPIENSGKEGSFEHYTFGGLPVVTQPARPFFFRDLARRLPAVEKAALAALDDAAASGGFR